MADREESSAGGRLKVAAALRSRNYRLFFAGQSISLIGTWMQRLAMSWLVYRLAKQTGTESYATFMLGAQAFTSQIPMFTIAPWTGVLVDRWDKRRVLALTQIAAMVQAFILAALVASGMAQVWHTFVLGIALGVVSAFDFPVRQAFVVSMIERREDLPNAIALNSFLVNFAKIFGPSLAGVVLATSGEAVCFLANGLSYIAVVAAVLAMRVPSHVKPQKPLDIRGEFREGFAYVRAHFPIKSIILLVLVVSIAAFPYTDLLPVMVGQVFHGDQKLFGMLRAAPGLGAIVGGAWLASRNSASGLARVLPIGAALFGVCLLAFTFVPDPHLAAIFLVVSGFGMITQMASSNTIVQTAVDDDKRGRVMSLYAMAMQGSMPWGSLLAGSVAASIGVPNTFRIGGAVCVVAALVFALNLRKWHPIGSRFLGADSAAGHPEPERL